MLKPKIACKSAIGYDNLEKLKQDLLNTVKQAAADEILSRDYERINPAIRSEVRALATEYVRISGSEHYYNDSEDSDNLCISIAPYIAIEDNIRAIKLSQKTCVPAVGDYQQLERDAEEKAIIRFDMPPVVINCPASINNGIARRSQESNPKNIL